VVQQLIAMLGAAVLMTAIAVVAVAITGGLPPRLALTGPTWEWTGTTSGSGASPLVVADPAAYTITFDLDRTFTALADCDELRGTYGVVAAGRAGGAVNALTLTPEAAGMPACGAGSLADVYVEQLASASRYVIDGTRLTITLVSRATMTFDAVVAAAGPTPEG
jgi:hypothetical protein